MATRIDGLSKAIGDELRRQREDKGWSRDQLAGRLPGQPHGQTLATYERGTRHLTVVRLAQLCDALGVNMCTLLRRAQDADTATLAGPDPVRMSPTLIRSGMVIRRYLGTAWRDWGKVIAVKAGQRHGARGYWITRECDSRKFFGPSTKFEVQEEPHEGLSHGT